MITARDSIKLAIGIVFLIAAGVGCASAPTAPTPEDTTAKQFQTQPGMGSVYICRGSGISGELLAHTRVDASELGGLAAGSYQQVNVTPGHHTVSVFGPSNEEILPVDVLAGGIYFFRVSMVWAGPGIRHRHIEVLNDTEGRQFVEGETLSQTTTTNPS